MMKMTKLSLAVASVLAAGNAFALAPNAINPQAPTANDVVIHYAGATAQSQTVQNLTASVCQPGTRNVYENGKNGDSATHLVVTCTLSAPASLAGKNLYFAYHLDGGSVYGVTPVADQVALPYMKVFGGDCTNTGTGTDKCVNTAAFQYSKAPVAGGSDVEPAMFKGSNVVGLAFPAPSAAGLANLTVEPAFNVIFGIAVNKALLDGTVYPGGTGTIKSLSKSSVATIFSGVKAQWDAIPEFGNMENWVNGIGTPTDIHVCRRKAGSGTQAAVQAYFLDQECSLTERPFATAGSWSVPGELEEINSSTNILTQCANTNTRAIAVSSLEKQPGSKYGTNWAYVAIDGIMPTEENAATGKYDYMFENSMQYNNTVISANQKAFMDELFAAAKDAAVLAGKDGVLGVPDYVINVPGDFADADSDGIYAEYHASNPVAWTSRDTQACKTPVQVFP